MDTNRLIFELSETCKRLGIKGAVIGISGGKDSTIVARIMSMVLGSENVYGVLMPNDTQTDIRDSLEVMDVLGIRGTSVNISDCVTSLIVSTENAMPKGFSSMAKLNVPPRIRMTILYSIAQSLGDGWRVIGTTNKSEEYIGWLTKWGDGGCDFEPIIDFTVTELKQLGKELGLPTHLVDKTPADGLADGSDEERFGFTYSQLDRYIETGTSGDKEIDQKILKMHENSQHKRVPIPKFNKGG